MQPLPVFSLDAEIDIDASRRVELLGGKGASLVEMTQRLALPVPPGFVLGTPLCAQVLATGVNTALRQNVESQITRLESRTGRSFGGGHKPLLVSVRSGAPVSMPGMMDTILNLGINEHTVAALARETGDAIFAHDSWWRFCRMYAATVIGLADETTRRSEGVGEEADTVRSLCERIDHLRRRCEQAGHPIPDDPRTQLLHAVEAVFRSSRSERARIFREREGLKDEVPTAVVVQAMVFGNLGLRSGTGVAFTRNPSTGENKPIGDYLPNAQGEDVVAGTHKPLTLVAMAERVPQAYQALARAMVSLETHYRDLCDIEFTVQEGELFVLQSRVGKRSAQAAVRIAVEMVRDPRIGLPKDQAIARITPDQMRQLQSQGTVQAGAQAVAQGIGVSPGVASGVVCTDPDRVAEWVAKGHKVVLVREDTSPHDVHGMVASIAIVTSTGGQLSHAALVARAWGIVAVCAVQSLRVGSATSVAGRTLFEGDVLTVDGQTGKLYLGDVTEQAGDESEHLLVLRQWAGELGQTLGEHNNAGAAGSTARPARSANAGGATAGSVNKMPVAAMPGEFALLRTLALAGFARPEKLGLMLGAPPEAVTTLLNSLASDLAVSSPRGWHLGPAGKSRLAEGLRAERAGIETGRAEAIYTRFMAIDATLKLVITHWQVRQQNGQSLPNDHSDQDYDALVLDRFAAMHREVVQLLPEVLAVSDRLWPYPHRFERAFKAISDGDHSMIASPLKDSYHSIWFELHEELIHLSGRDRASVERAHR